MKFRFSFLLASIVILTLLFSSHSSEQKKTRSLKKAVDNFSSDNFMRSASWGFMVYDVTNGKELYSVNPELGLIPASTQKVVTTLTALATMGADYRFETLLQYDGKIEKNVLNGNLYITGSGDPSLGATQLHDSLDLLRVFDFWLQDLKKTGTTNITGDIIADGSLFDDHMIPPKWMWEDIGNYYGAGAHALTVYENMYTVFFQPGTREGDPAKVLRTEPVVPDMEFINDVTTGPRGSGDRVYIYGVPGQNTRWLTGTVPLGQNDFPVRGSLPDPGFFLAQSFKNFLAENGITVQGQAHTHRSVKMKDHQSARVIVSRWESPELLYIAKRTNLASVNTYAENLLKKMGIRIGGEGSFQKGASVVSDFWKEKGIETTGLRIHDGSGLSPFNNITVRQLNEMLVYAAGDEMLYTHLIKGFPVAGESGSLSRLFRGTSSQGVLTAKSGFLSNVRAYSGYTRNKNGNLIAFTFIVNNYAGPNIQLRDNMVRVMDAISEL